MEFKITSVTDDYSRDNGVKLIAWYNGHGLAFKSGFIVDNAEMVEIEFEAADVDNLRGKYKTLLDECNDKLESLRG